MKVPSIKINQKTIISVNFIAILVVANLLLSFISLPRIDLTKNKIHTLSKSSLNIIKELEDIVNVTVFMSENLPPQAKPSIDSLKNILTEIARTNPTRLIVTYKNPNTDNLAKQEAINLGIQPIQFSTVEQDSFQVNNAFLGIVVSYGQKQEVMPVASDIGNLEYFLLSSIKKLTTDTVPTIAIAFGHGQVEPDKIKNIGQYLGQTYTPTLVDTDSQDWQIPPNSLLVLLSPQQDFSQQDIDKLKQHLSSGKAILVFFDQFQVNPNLIATKVDTPNFLAFLSDYGFQLQESIVLDQSSNITNFSTQSSQFIVQYPYWLSIRPENMNSDLPVFTNVSSISLNWASPIKISDSAKYLLKSSKYSFTSQDTNLSPITKVDFESQDLSQSVVAAINTENVKIGLVSDVDFIKDEFLNNQASLFFVTNLIDYLNSNEALMSIRNKTLLNHPLNLVDPAQKQIIRWANILIIPLLILFIFLLSKKLQSISHPRKK